MWKFIALLVGAPGLVGCNAVGDPIGSRVAAAVDDDGASASTEDDQAQTPASSKPVSGEDSSPAADAAVEPGLSDAGSEQNAEPCEPTVCLHDVPLSERDSDGDGLLDVYDTDDDDDGVSDQRECGFAGGVGLVNGEFEVPFINEQAVYRMFAPWDVPGWLAVPDGAYVELWTDGHNGVPALGGRQFAELNVDFRTGIYQDFVTEPETKLRWIFAHRGREGADTVRILLGTPDTMQSLGEFRTGVGEWTTYAGTYEIPEGQTQTRIMLEAVSGEAAANFIDQVWIEPQCERDSDGDGCVDSEDPDSCQ